MMTMMHASMSALPTIDILDDAGGWGGAELDAAIDIIDTSATTKNKSSSGNKKSLNDSWNNIDYLDELLLASPTVKKTTTGASATLKTPRSTSAIKKRSIKSKSKSSPLSARTSRDSTRSISNKSRPSSSLLPDCLPIEREAGDDKITTTQEVLGVIGGDMKITSRAPREKDGLAMSSLHSTNTESTAGTTGSDSSSNPLTPTSQQHRRYHRSSRSTRRSKTKSLSSPLGVKVPSLASSTSCATFRSPASSSSRSTKTATKKVRSTDALRNATFSAPLNDSSHSSSNRNASFDTTTKVKKPLSSSALRLGLSPKILTKRSIRGNSDLFRKSNSGNNLRSLVL